LKGPRVELVPVAPEHRERLDELRRLPEVVRWWKEPWGDWLEQGRTVTFHLDAHVDGATSQTVDHLTVDDSGRIAHLEVGFR